MKKIFFIASALVILAGCAPVENAQKFFNKAEEDIDTAINSEKENSKLSQSEKDEERILVSTIDEKTNASDILSVDTRGEVTSLSLDGYALIESVHSNGDKRFFIKDGDVYWFNAKNDEMQKTSLPKVDPKGEGERVEVLSQVAINDSNSAHLTYSYFNTNSEQFVQESDGLGLLMPSSIIEYLYSIDDDSWQEVSFLNEVEQVVETAGSIRPMPFFYDQKNNTLFARISGEGAARNVVAINRENNALVAGIEFEVDAISVDNEHFIDVRGDRLSIIELDGLDAKEILLSEPIEGSDFFYDPRMDGVYAGDADRIVRIDINTGEVVELYSGDIVKTGAPFIVLGDGNVLVNTTFLGKTRVTFLNLVDAKEETVLKDEAKIYQLLGKTM